MKRLYKRILFLGLFFIISLNCKCFADDEIDEVTLEDYNVVNNTTQEVSADLSKEPETYSKHIICIERTTNEVLYEKDAYSKTPMASTTKIMTAIIVLENCDLSENVKISTKAANTDGSTLGITAGSTISLESLMYGLLLRSRK